MTARTEAAAYAYALSQVKGIGARSLARVSDSFPHPEQLLQAASHEVIDRLGSSLGHAILSTLSNTWPALWSRALEFIERHAERSIEVIPFNSEEYPSLLKQIPDPPPILFVKGNLTLLKRFEAVAVVGTRNPTEAGKQIALKVASHFAAKGYVVVSGLAKGIDTMAHLGALESSGSTLAVLGTSLEKVYPAENKSLANRIVQESGLLVTEFGIGQQSYPTAFVQRDRIQSGLSLAIIPVQTDVKGGTMHTVRFAEEHGRLIFCPRPMQAEMNAPQSAGVIGLIRSGKATAFTAEDYDSIFAQLEQQKTALLSDNRQPAASRDSSFQALQGELGLESEAGYQDLPSELKVLWNPKRIVVPSDLRRVISGGWARMSWRERELLLKSLAETADPLAQVLDVTREAARALLT